MVQSCSDPDNPDGATPDPATGWFGLIVLGASFLLIIIAAIALIAYCLRAQKRAKSYRVHAQTRQDIPRPSSPHAMDARFSVATVANPARVWTGGNTRESTLWQPAGIAEKRFDRAVPRIEPRRTSSYLVEAYDGPQAFSAPRDLLRPGSQLPAYTGSVARACFNSPACQSRGGGTAASGFLRDRAGGGRSRDPRSRYGSGDAAAGVGGAPARPGAGSARLDRQGSADGRGPLVRPRGAWD